MDKSKWHILSTQAQLANIGAEVGRTISWKQNPSFGHFTDAFYRALEYLDLSIEDPKHAGARRKELCRLREVLVDWHLGSHLYGSSDQSWANYFNPFAVYTNISK